MQEKVEEHYHRFFGPHKSARVDLAERHPCDLLIFPPSDRRLFHTIATRGLCAKVVKTPAGMDGYARQEFLIYLPGSWTVDLEKPKLVSSWPCMYLYYAARHILDNDVFMAPGSVGHTENARAPGFEKFPYALYVPPLVESPDFFPLKIDGYTVQFTSIIPMTEAEAQFMKANGFRALLTAMVGKERFSPLFDPMRTCAVSDYAAPEVAAEQAVREYAFEIANRDEAVQEHYSTHFGKPAKVYKLTYDGETGLTSDRLLNLLIFAPNAQRPFYTVATRGVSDSKIDLPPNKAKYMRQEMLVYLPSDWNPDFSKKPEDLHWACKLLLNLSYLSFKKKGISAPLFIIPNGKSFEEGSALSSILMTWPLFESSNFNALEVEGEPIRFSQLVPISVKETDFGVKRGVKLLHTMDSSGTLDQIIDAKRPCTFSLCGPRKNSYRRRMPDLQLPF